jgi:hypothetical protein
MKLAWEGIKGWGTANPPQTPPCEPFMRLSKPSKGGAFNPITRACYKYSSPPESIQAD